MGKYKLKELNIKKGLTDEYRYFKYIYNADTKQVLKNAAKIIITLMSTALPFPTHSQVPVFLYTATDFVQQQSGHSIE
jgi:hypothetical protein